MRKPRAILFVALIAGCGTPSLSVDEDLGTLADAAAPAADLSGCSPACSGPNAHCNASHHCVACLTDGDCAKGSYCKIASDAIATCTPGCTGDGNCANGQTCCGMQCVDTAVDPGNCGACGTTCAVGHAASSCVASKCQLGACDQGWGDCDKDAKNGCEASLSSDPDNCTGCGQVCALANAMNGCADGCYLKACLFGFDDCNNDPKDGCEKSVATDVANCGGCGKVCPGLPHAKITCAAGQCMIGSCDMGYADCDGDTKNGCESAVAADAKNCGGCGVVCPMNLPACNKGVCGTAFTSCLALLNGGKSNGDGVYQIDPSGGQQAPITVYCDMTTDGGGWTLVHKNNKANSNDRTDAGWNVAALQSPTVDDVAVLPRATIAAISPASEFRVIAVNGYRIFSLGGMPYYTTDAHANMTWDMGKMKYAWADQYFAQKAMTGFVQHSTLVCSSVNGCTGNDSGHMAVQRYCCGNPNAGFWFNGTQRFQPGYYAGAGWMR